MGTLFWVSLGKYEFYDLKITFGSADSLLKDNTTLFLNYRKGTEDNWRSYKLKMFFLIFCAHIEYLENPDRDLLYEVYLLFICPRGTEQPFVHFGFLWLNQKISHWERCFCWIWSLLSNIIFTLYRLKMIKLKNYIFKGCVLS